ncbi:MAG: Ig-like domain-containing protein [Gemmatimonadales bacterium]
MPSRPPGRFRHLAFLGTSLVLGLTLFIQACTKRDVVGVVVGSVVVSPATASVQEGETQAFTAVVRDEDGDELEGAAVEWSSLDPGIASVDATGLVRGVLRGTTTIRASRDGISGTAQITVLQTAGIAVSQASGPTTEAGGTATFTIVLESRPDADVTIALSSSDSTEGEVSPASLTFTPADWDDVQTVTATGQNDDIADGNVGYTILTAAATSTDARYAGLDADDVLITNNDDDTPGISVSPVSGPTTEAGGLATFTVVLTSQPIADVTIGISSDDTTEGTVNVPSLTFTSTNWQVPQTVVVTGRNDPVADGNIVYHVVTAAATSADANYQGMDAADVSITNVDDETAGVTVSPPTGPTTEEGGQATFTVVLNAAPTADVTIGLSSNDVTEGTISTPSLLFTDVNWNVAQTVTVTGQDDFVDDGDIQYTIVTAPAVSADPNYNGLNASDVAMTNVDDETAGITISPPTGPTTEAGGTATFTVRLNSQPTANVTITLSSSDATEGTVLTSSLTFNGTDWSVPKQVTVRGENDSEADGNIPYFVVVAAATSTDPLYNGFDAPDVMMTNVDDETPGITLSAPSGPTTEVGGQATFTVVLNTQPTGAVTIGLTSSDLTEGTVSPASVTFNPSGAGLWSTPQTVTVTGQNDAIDDGDVVYSIVTGAAVSADPNYSGRNAADVLITNIDDETAGVTVSPISGPTTEAGGTATFTVVLNSEPTANVTIAVSTSDATEGVVTVPASGTLTFTPSGPGMWSTPQTVTVRGQDDLIVDGNIVYTVVTAPAASADLGYDGLNAADVSVTNVDDETAGITVSAISGPTTEAGGQALFTVVLNNQPAASVQIGISSSDITEGTVSVSSLTFTTGNWNVPQTVTITGVNDAVDDDNVVYTIVTAPSVSTDTNYNGINAADVSVTNVDDDTAGITVSAASGPTTEGGGTATFTIRLNSEPTANVVIALSSNDLTEGTVSPSSVTFTPSGPNIWSSPRTITVTGVNDAIDDDNIVYQIVTAAAVSADPKYSGMNAPDVTFTNVDDDAAGIAVSPASGPTTEAGGTATFTVVLLTAPSANVTVGITSSDPTEGTVSTGLLTFTTGTWGTPQTVTVTGQNDDVDDGDVAYTIVTAPATSTDTRYNGVNGSDVSITNIDNDQAGIVVSPASGPTTEAGGTATFTVALTSEPTANVTIGVSSSDLTEGVVSSPAGGTLTFTPSGAGAWNVAQTVTVTGVNDVIDDDNVAYSIVTAPATSADPSYNGMNAADVTMTNIDDETAGITVSAISGPTTETGGTATFTIVLTTAPSAPVTIGLSSNDLTEGTVSPSSLTFNPTAPNIWSTPRTVTVTGVNDAAQDGNIVYTIVTAPATSSDPSYNGVNAADVSVTNIDDETAGITVSAISGPTTENGGTATFTVILNSQPTANVTIGLSSSDATEGSVTTPAGGTLTFTPSGAGIWSTPQTVTVTGQNDDVDDGNIAYSIVTAAAASSDPLYNGVNPADVAVTNVDDDVAGVTVSAPTGPTTEEGGIAQFTVRLNSEPTAVVAIAVVSTDATEGMVTSTSPLEFSSGNWNVPQTVTVTGIDDDIDDDIVAYSITTSATSSDAAYNNIAVADVPITNVDDTDLAGINVTPVTGLVTTEAGGTAQFTVVLNSQPVANVSLGVSSDDPTEGQVTAGSSLLFTAANWNAPQTVTVTGQDDSVDDASVAYTIATAPATSTDPKYNGRNAADVAATNTDDGDTAGIIVSPTSGLLTTEAGGQATFTVQLTSEPTATVTISVASSDNTEGVASPALLTFTPTPGANAWNNPHTVTVTGANDFVDDGDLGYTIFTGQATSTDGLYGAIDPPDVSASNTDDDTAGFTVSAITGATTEAGGTATFTIVLTSEPTANVTVGVTSSDTSEGTVSPATLTFTPTAGANAWNTPHTVTVTGVNDFVDDGNVAYSIVTAQATSADPLYSPLDPNDVPVSNTDNDTAGFTVSAISGPTTEAGGTATFTVVLTSEPTANVTVGLTSSDLTEGTVSPSSVTFTPSGPGIWSTPQLVTVTGVDDDVDDGDVVFSIIAGQITTTDPVYAGINPSDVTITNTDDDTNDFTITESGGTTQVIDGVGPGNTDDVTIVLTAQPLGTVVLTVTSGDTGEFSVDPADAEITFTPANWNVPRTIDIFGVADGVADGNQSILLTVAVDDAQSHNAWDPLPNRTVTVTVVDID